jgi:DNA segregation ATPase FtsK/SpoIIIE, S-DNA-T family
VKDLHGLVPLLAVVVLAWLLWPLLGKRSGVSLGSTVKNAVPSRESNRSTGSEWRAFGWVARHPGFVLAPVSVGLGAAELGLAALAGMAGGVGAGLLGWYRGHPNSFDTLAAPRLRALHRRWLTRYTGRAWSDVTMACDLAPTHRRTGVTRVPRILRVRSYSPSIDTVWVRLVPGQSVTTWEEKAVALADALGAVRVAVEKIRPQIIALIVERSEPFTEVIDAPEMPAESAMVDLGAVYLGQDEYGADWCEAIIGQHWLGTGATGAGKASLIWAPLRSMAPMIRDGLVRLWFVDPKKIELSRGRDIAHRYAAEPEDCLALIEEFAEDCRQTQRRLSCEGKAKFTPTPETPLNVLVMDELAALLAFGKYARDVRRLLEEIGTQGRATGHAMLGAVQEPSKDVVPVRDLFTVRICLRVTSAAHVDMTLGDGARLRGAMADEIPNDPSTAGIGFIIRRRSRVPARVRAAYVDDHEIAELVRYVTAGAPGTALRAVS